VENKKTTWSVIITVVSIHTINYISQSDTLSDKTMSDKIFVTLTNFVTFVRHCFVARTHEFLLCV